MKELLLPIWQDLKARKLVPVVVGLLVAIVAVPIVLSGSSSSAPPPVAAAPPPPADGLPAVSDTSVSANAAPGGKARNPFGPSSAAASVPTTGTTAAAATSTPVNGGTTATTPSQGSSSSTGTSTTGGTTPSTAPSSGGGGGGSTGPTHIPTPKPKKPTPALAADQSYSVSLAITNSTGGVNTISPLERLSLLPSAGNPLLVEMGVLKGGSRVLFAVQPGTVVSGPGQCIPGPIDCEILSLGQAQTETLSVHSPSGTVKKALFAVTGINAVTHSSHSAAMKVRDQESKAGRRVLGHSSLNALSLFRYVPGVGAVVDLRNLTLRDS